MDKQGNCTFWNAEAEKLLGWRREEVLGKNIHNLIHYQDYSGKRIHQDDCVTRKSILANQAFHSEDDVFTHKNGDLTPIEITAVPLMEQGEMNGSVAVFSDITERKAQQKQLNEALASEKEANQAKSDFLANMSHEIRTPMNGIIGMTDLALDTDLSAEQKEYLNLIKQSSSALLAIINDILDFSKIEAGKLELEEIEFELPVVLRETVQTLTTKAQEKGLTIELNLAANIPNILLGDPGRLRQIILNLVNNAIKFTNEGGISINVDAQVSGTEKSCLVFSVKDTGIGIPNDKQENIFQSFSQADSSVSRKFGGTGLGLSICQQLVELMAGKIWLESKAGFGSTFFFSAWFKTPLNEQALNPQPALEQMKVLIVENETNNRNLLQQTLSHWGMQVAVAENYRSAIELLSAAKQDNQLFQLILFDPEEKAEREADLVKQMCDQNIDIPAFILLLPTTQISKKFPEYDHFPLKGYLTKPLSQSDVLDEIQKLLGGVTQSEKPVEVEPEKIAVLETLVAEDNKVNQKLAIRLLEKHDHAVTIANNGVEAIELYQKRHFDLILMDFQMPVMGGIEAAKEIRAIEQNTGDHIIIIAMTANAMKEDMDKAIEAGMDDYVSKPISTDELFGAIQKFFPAHRNKLKS